MKLLETIVLAVIAVCVTALTFNTFFADGKPLGSGSGQEHFNLEMFYAGILSRDAISVYTADRALSPSESGKKIYIGTAGVDLTLPVPEAGLNYQVYVNANFATTPMKVQGPASGASDDVMFGSLEVAGAVVLCSAEDTLTFVETAELPGDFIDIRSDGTNWYVTGQAGTSGGITCTDAD